MDWIIPGHGNIGGKKILAKLRSYLTDIRENMARPVKSGFEKHDAIESRSPDRFFQADIEKGPLGAKQRKETFKKGRRSYMKI